MSSELLLTADGARAIAFRFLHLRQQSIDPFCRNPPVQLSNGEQVLWFDSYTPVYEFAFENGEAEPAGFVLVWGTRKAEPILGYSFTGRSMTQRHADGLEFALKERKLVAVSVRWFYFGPLDIVAEVTTTKSSVLHIRLGAQKLVRSRQPFRFRKKFKSSKRIKELWNRYDEDFPPPPDFHECFLLHCSPTLYRQTCRKPTAGDNPDPTGTCGLYGLCIAGCVPVAFAVLASAYARLGYFNGVILIEDQNWRNDWPTNGTPPVAPDKIVERYIWNLHSYMQTTCAGVTNSSMVAAGTWFFEIWNQFLFFKQYQNINFDDLADFVKVDRQPLLTTAEYAWNKPTDPTVDGHAFVITGYDRRDDSILISMGWGDKHKDWWAPFHQLNNVSSYYLVDSPLEGIATRFEEVVQLEGFGQKA